MPRRRPARFVALVHLLARVQPDVEPSAVTDGRVFVDGRVVAKPRALVRADASVRVQEPRRLRGARKLADALDAFDLVVAGRVALDAGANAGGFTTVLLERGARRVYAVEVGVGQLRGVLRVDERVVNLERTNIAALDHETVPDTIDVVTIDIGHLALAEAVRQLAGCHIAPDADLVALVKPTFELRRGTLAASDEDIEHGVRLASRAIAAAGWTVIGKCDAPRTGRRRAREVFVRARRSPSADPSSPTAS